MLIDWVTVGAQIVNFLILVVLLKKFLYGPIVRAMEAREQRIADRMQEAREERAAAREEKEKYEAQNRDIEEKKTEMLEVARRDSEMRRKEWLEEAREQAERKRSEWLQAVEREKQSFLRDLRDRAGRGVFRVARRVLNDLSDADLQDQVLRAFLRRLRDLEKSGLEFDPSGKRIMVASAFDLDEEQRGKISGAIRERLAPEREVTFTTSPTLICGIEMKVNGHKISWSVRDYLLSLEQELNKAFEESRPFSEDETEDAAAAGAGEAASEAGEAHRMSAQPPSSPPRVEPREAGTEEESAAGPNREEKESASEDGAVESGEPDERTPEKSNER